MIKRIARCLCTLSLVVFSFTTKAFAETVGLFFDSGVPQIEFAATDVKTALESKNFKVEMFPLNALSAKYPNKKVVLGLASNEMVSKLLVKQQGTIPTGLGEQAYGLRTTDASKKSYWILGGDANGVMYGGFQIAENINFNGFTTSYNNEESPAILKRGIKLNFPFDLNTWSFTEI